MLVRRRWFATRVVIASIGLGTWTDQADAGGNDFHLNARRNGDGLLFTADGPNRTAFARFSTELAYTIAARTFSPAETLGHAGFSFAGIFSTTSVSADEAFWQVTESAQRTGRASPWLTTLGVEARKGLPYSLELGAMFTWLVDSAMFAPAFEVRFAPVEGLQNAPDIALRGSLSHLVGSRDLNLTVVGVDAIVSRAFGVAGTVNITPYLGWAVLMVAASSRVIDPTPGDELDFGASFVFPELKPASNLHHRLTLGARVLSHILNVSIQGEFEMFEDRATGVAVFGRAKTIAVKLGLDY